MKKELAYNIIDILNTIQEAVRQMREQYAADNMESFYSLSVDVRDGLLAVQQVARQETTEGSRIRLADACTCALESLKDIKNFALDSPQKVVWKLDYELASIVEVTAMQFYYWGIVNEYPEEHGAFKRFLLETETFKLLRMTEQEYEYDLSIMVTGYNHLDFTTQCIESILKQLPRKIKYQLILLNHGSTDDTKDFFEKLDSVKVINIAINGIMPLAENKAISRGRYYLWISNDIVIGHNAIENLYRCIAEHPQYGFIVPTTPNVSNFQMIPAEYNSRREFEEFAEQNNIYDERKHEQRVRLCTPAHLMSSEIWTKLMFSLYEDLCCNKNVFSYIDDKYSLWMRRNNYKCILAKDAYCHHFGSVTLKHDLGKQLEQQKFYQEGRQDFFETYGVDPWGIGFCYDLELFNYWKINAIDNAVILGINCGLGSNSLKVKEIMREKGAKNITLYNATQKKSYLQDLQGVSDKAFSFDRLTDIVAETGRKKFNYVVIEGKISHSEGKTVEKLLEEANIQYDEMAVRTSETTWQIVKGSIN